MDELIQRAGGRSVEPAQADQNLLLEAIAQAGKTALSFYRASPETQHKSDGTLVSEADLAVDAALKEALLGARPDYGWISEESAPHARADPQVPTWIIDPIDGTRAFLNEIPDWTISVALIEHDRPILAAVYNPVHGELFRAARGHGAFLNDAPMSVSDARDPKGSQLAMTQRMMERETWRQPWPDFERAWVKSIAYRLALVASGRFDAAVFYMAHDWDIAAAQLLVEEAGGIVTNKTGAPLFYDGSTKRQDIMIAAGPALHGALISRVAL